MSDSRCNSRFNGQKPPIKTERLPDFSARSTASNGLYLASIVELAGDGEICGDDASSRRKSGRRDPSVAERPLTLTLPIEGAYNSLTGKYCAGLFGGSNGEFVSFQLEEPDLGRTGQNLVPR
jgi:hypothetical protein